VERIARGDIWVVEPIGHRKPRPALVVSIDPVNDLCPDVLLVPITSKAAPLRVPISGPSGETGLQTTSYAKCESVGPVHKSRLKRRIGLVPPARLGEIEAGLMRVLGLPGSASF
jgi:mRNA-degrading endonuclease toxin of MazEF toxin-antitoxin module